MEQYIIGIDQSTQGTKAVLFDSKGQITARKDASHRQIVNDKGWVEHDPNEIYHNTIRVVTELISEQGVDVASVKGIGISNQRETVLVWDKVTGEPVNHAIVWQCARAEEICKRIEHAGHAQMIREKTGLKLSPYFSASKAAWILEHVPGCMEKASEGKLCIGTIDSWLIYKLTGGQSFYTDYSNASRTQLFNIHTLTWDDEICSAFGINIDCLPKVMDSNSLFGTTDLEGYSTVQIPIHAALGDSHAALYGQGCQRPGMIKATYGTGSSVMMNIGSEPIISDAGVVTSLAWGMDGKVDYVLEGNINYTGSVITWLQKDLGIIDSYLDAQKLVWEANPSDRTYLVPAFTGLGAPYWDSDATGIFCGITRVTKKAELVRAGVECIAYQIADVIHAMKQSAGITIEHLRTDGGPTQNVYLMQFQSDILDVCVDASKAEELSAIGAAYAAGIAAGLYQKDEIFEQIKRTHYIPVKTSEWRSEKYNGWKAAVNMVLSKN